MWKYPSMPVDQPRVKLIGFPRHRRRGVWRWVRWEGGSKPLLLMSKGRCQRRALEVGEELVVVTLSVEIRQPLQLGRGKHSRQRARPQQWTRRRTSRGCHRRRGTGTSQRRRGLLRPLRTTNYTVYAESDLRLRWHRHHRGRCERHHAFAHNGSVTKLSPNLRSTCYTEHNPS